MKKRGETITDKQMLTEEPGFIIEALRFWRERVANLPEGDLRQTARDELASWEALAAKLDVKL